MEQRSVFIKKEKKSEPGFNVGVILNKSGTKGDVGIEIEVEGENFPKNQSSTWLVPEPWAYHADGSLRGKDNAEYVLQGPIDFDMVPKALDNLWESFTKCKTVIDESNRTSVHVHLNCQKFHMNRLASFLALYFTFEEILTEWCGDHRVGNLFCLRAKDAPAIITQLKKFVQQDGRYELRENVHHYAGMNGSALHKFGSLEVRTLRGVADPSTILNWVSILRRLYDLSEAFPDPRGIPASFSQNGPMAFFEEILGEHLSVVRNGIDFDNERIRDSMYDGIRLAQDICYCRDWGVFQAIKLEKDPFGRDPRKIMKRLSQTGPMAVSEDGFETYDEAPAQTYAPVLPYAPMPMATFQATWGDVLSTAPTPLEEGPFGDDA